MVLLKVFSILFIILLAYCALRNNLCAQKSYEDFFSLSELGGTKLIAYQYTYAYRSYVSFGHGGRVVPAIWFRYDLNPITVKYHESRPPLYHFLTTVCAIVGGTFTVAGIIDSVIFSGMEIFKKFELGKLS